MLPKAFVYTELQISVPFTQAPWVSGLGKSVDQLILRVDTRLGRHQL